MAVASNPSAADHAPRPPSLAGAAVPARARSWTATAPTSRSGPARPTRCRSLCSTPTASRPGAAARAHLRHLARLTCPASRPGQRYGFRTDGPLSARRRAVPRPEQTAARPVRPGDRRATHRRPERVPRQRGGFGAARTPRCVVVADEFDWGDERRPHTPWNDSVIYELHVTRLHRAVARRAGTRCAGRTPVWPTRSRSTYLRDLGVTAVELLPVHHFGTEPAISAPRA